MLSPRQYKDVICEHFAHVAKALGSAKRIELLDLLSQSPRRVEGLAQLTGMSVANTSQHLQVLRGAALVEADKAGSFVTYRLAGPDVAALLVEIRHVAESRIAEVDRVTRRFLAGREGMERVDQETLVDRIRRGEVTLLDVRPSEEYEAGHIPGAISVPLSELKKRLRTLPKDEVIVAYCRGPYCVLAMEAVGLLSAKGFQAARLEDGVQDWRARGYAVALGGALQRRAARA
ncbi:MAG: metalloregulator ArsR/SmtB family transcription factor [Acidobacteria bacterium]|nr:metalloregulator ArsR/SmtB family transcription factor [Acidobacteriota bacterium]